MNVGDRAKMRAKWRGKMIDDKFGQWVDDLTCFGVFMVGVKVAVSAIFAIFAMGLIVGLPLWGLYVLFFEVMS